MVALWFSWLYWRQYGVCWGKCLGGGMEKSIFNLSKPYTITAECALVAFVAEYISVDRTILNAREYLKRKDWHARFKGNQLTSASTCYTIYVPSVWVTTNQ